MYGYDTKRAVSARTADDCSIIIMKSYFQLFSLIYFLIKKVSGSTPSIGTLRHGSVFANGTAMSEHYTNLADVSNEYQLLIYYHIFASHELIDVNDENYAIHNENHNSHNFYNTINI